MILRLLIENLVLVERADIAFGPGLNILTGETGAGKSAILSAIRLILGERAESDLVRQGAPRAVVEASIRLDGEEVVVRRELSATAKSRIFLDEAQVTLQELRERLHRSLQLVDQSSALELREPELQRRLLDEFARVDTDKLGDVVRQLDSARGELARVEGSAAHQSAEESRLLEDLAAIRAVRWAPGEDEALSREHHLLTNAHEILRRITQVNEALAEGQNPIISLLRRFANLLGNEPTLQPASDALKTASLELEEAAHGLTRIAEQLEANPERLARIEERIGAIEALKRRFGARQEDVEAERKALEARLERIAHLDDELAAARKNVAELDAKAARLSAALSAERCRAAPRFVSAVLAELRGLNLQHAQLDVSITEKPLSANGIDAVEIRFAANPGQPLGALSDQASGGELSRLLFAVKAALAEQDVCSSLIFDEIDSNVGGQTAARLGEKLLFMAKRRQLICVTHFVQVARCAMHHFAVAKTTKNQKAVTQVARLEGVEREREFARMMGA